MIVVLGSVNRDVVVEATRLPKPGETVIGRHHFEAPGGKGANQAVAAARLGAEVRFLGRVGDDAAGRWLVEGLEAEGVDISDAVVERDAPSGLAVITVDAAAENAIVVVPGANGRVSPSDVVSWRPVIEAADVVLMQLEVPMDTVVAAAQVAAGTVILNPAPAPPPQSGLPARLLHRVDVLVANQSEVEAVGDAEVPVLIVTLGADGAELRRGGRSETVEAPLVEAIDTTGAGDAFCGALAVALDEDLDLAVAVRMAVHAGSLATTALGARTAVPTRAELEAFLR